MKFQERSPHSPSEIKKREKNIMLTPEEFADKLWDDYVSGNITWDEVNKRSAEYKQTGGDYFALSSQIIHRLLRRTIRGD